MALLSEETENQLTDEIMARIEAAAERIAKTKVPRYMRRGEVSEYTRLKGASFDELIINGLKAVKYGETGKVYDRKDVDAIMDQMKG